MGAVFNCSVLATGGYTIDPNTISWSGGTYKSYFSNLPTESVKSTPSLSAVSVTPIYATDRIQPSFQAIADPDTATMVIKVTCSNYDPNSSLHADLPPVSTTLTANVVKPTLAKISGKAGTVQFFTNPSMACIAMSPPTVFQIQTSTGAFGGMFMILQIVPSGHNSWNLPDGGYYWDTPGPSRDDGTFGQNKPLGYPVGNYNNNNNGWWMTPNFNSGLLTASDSPNWWTDPSAYSLSSSNSFQTYLMYQPSGGVWVALSETDWSYQLKVVNNPWPADFSMPAPAPQDSTPSGAAAFPGWITTTSAIVQDYRP